ncbi:hypothetical protein PtA15_5A320 [Puccinia triticina]|uniref:FAR1 domain-containing protein n=1 Tax=Puccinia triticina TaxID=208348 RepID=A0ABY7CPQ7_9BASI|nr:uncharacterized protein PtA15_5A320 [Puccinia triticina]WAQ84747.1 hypothetical protein PtA15_5A320 [Puccinia triticina]WAR58090.1 hypothetical protein PtB15_5B322 [Puccinia triticina]
MAAANTAPANHIPLCEPSPVDDISPRLPRVGDLFDSWDDFRTWSRKAAEARGFTLSQSQSKGSSGTIVLRCSRFKEPGTVGQKMAENGCKVVFKVMRAKPGVEGFEVVYAFEEHNHPFGPDMPVGHRPGTSLSGQPPKRKKVKTSASGATSDVGMAGSSHSQNVSNGATPPASSSKPFLFDPYTGKPIRSSATPVPTANTPSPPTHLDPIHQPANPTLPPPAGQSLPRAPSSLSGTPRSHSSRAGSRTANYPHPGAVIPQQAESYPAAISPNTAANHLPTGMGMTTPSTHSGPLKSYPPLSVRLSVKAQNSITEFLSSLSPALAPYGTHFKWLGVQSPADLLGLVESGGEEELEVFLDEIDTCGIGARGEGVSQEEKSLIIRGLRKLSGIKSKSST